MAKKDFSSGGLVWDPKKKHILMVRVENLVGECVWTFPKGHPEKKETDEEAAIREVREETGWNCEISKPLTDVQYFYKHKGVTYDKTVRWFIMKPIKKVGEFDPKEILECQWKDFKTAQKTVTYESDKKLLKKLKEIFL